ncbi:MAG TPA: hypothetical protein VGL66_00750 [Caulobacteraceae bacterium]|jgi:hypothetical protein
MYIAIALAALAGVVLLLCWMAPWAAMFFGIAKDKRTFKSADDRELESLSHDLKDAEERLLHKSKPDGSD